MSRVVRFDDANGRTWISEVDRSPQPFHAQVADLESFQRAQRCIEVIARTAERALARANETCDVIDRLAGDVPVVSAIGDEGDGSRSRAPILCLSSNDGRHRTLSSTTESLDEGSMSDVRGNPTPLKARKS